MSHKWTIIVLVALSGIVRFAFFGHPNETVFDEVHFGKFVSGYYTGEYYFDIHPPLGKLMIAGFAKVVDFKPKYNFTEIGKEFPDKKYLALRFLPAVAGTLLPVIIYLLALELGMSRLAAFAGGLLLVFENSLLTQSRLILLDPLLLLFGFLSLLFYFKYRRRNHPQHSHILKNMRMLWDWNLFWMVIFGGLAASIKFTGLSFIALPIVIEACNNFAKYRRSDTPIQNRLINLSYDKFIKRVAIFCSFFVISLVIYFSVFALHFALLPKSGPGDAFMSASFQKTLNGSRYQGDPGIKPANLFSKFKGLNLEMYKSNQRLGATHPYSSRWYAWPFMARPIYYWVNENSRIYFFGNPVVWWTSTAAVLYFVFSISYLVFKKLNTIYKIPDTIYILLGGYVLNLLPFIGIKRVMFLYHYLAALVFAILILVYLLDKTKNAKRSFSILIIASITAFLFFAPLSYGLPLSDKAYEARVWFASWR